MKVVDKHGREFRGAALHRCRGQLFIGSDDADYNIDACGASEILALNWRDPAPETYEPPRDAKGRPVCRNDLVSWKGVRFDVTGYGGGMLSVNDKNAPPLLASNCTLLRFAGEDQDIGEVEGEWRHVPGAVAQYQHTSGAAVTPWNGKWSWARKGEPLCDSDMLVPTRAEAESLALGQSAPSEWAHAGDILFHHTSGARVCGEMAGSRWAWSLPGRAWCLEADCVPTRQEAERLALGQPAIKRGRPKKPAPATRPGDVLTVARRPISTTAAAAPAIVPQTEQARRVQQYAAFRTAVETACREEPGLIGSRVIVDLRPERRDTGRAANVLVIFEAHGQSVDWCSPLDEPQHAIASMRAMAAQWDREAGERLRRGK